MNRFVRPVLFALVLCAASSASAFCGPPLSQNHWGMPVDYRDPKETYKRDIVEKYHFTPEIENLVRGQNGPLPGDIHYTLIQLVSHHRALAAMANWQLKNQNHVRGPLDEYFEADCYFERALAFQPEDPLIWMIWGNYVFRKKEYERAVKIYSRAEELAPEDPEVQYNLGLLNFELKNYDKAKEYAQKAYAQNFPLPGLRNRLKRQGITLDDQVAAKKPEQTPGTQ
ncbi:MAG TPA: tetratricopeptide repeat protein [Steroidobacteraceae bacterium]|nr:tetratricopeptide repeat protein [Steroidobacteraceae bacterium]